MHNLDAFQVDSSFISFSVKHLVQAGSTCSLIFDFSASFISITECIKKRYCIKFCQKLGDTQVETIQKIQQAFGNEALSPTQIKQWFKHFKDGRASVESDPLSEDHPQAERRRRLIKFTKKC